MSDKEESVDGAAATPLPHDDTSGGESRFLGRDENGMFKESLAFINEFVETVGGRLEGLSKEDKNSFLGPKRKV